VLVVDDEPMILDLLRLVLQARWTVHCATSAAEAFVILDREPIDVVISDQRMPEVTGVELLSWVREQYPRCTRILLTGFSEMEAVVRGINEARIWRYATKPWDNRAMETMVEQAVERSWREARQRDQLVCGFRSLVRMQESCHPFTRGHSTRVAAIAEDLCDALSLPRVDRRQVVTAAELHDIGRIGVATHYLDVEGPLDERAWTGVRHHVPLGVGMLAEAGVEAPVVEMVAGHHERLDGSGYPAGIEGDDIPLGARILALADSLAAMTAPRAFRGPMDDRRALAELSREAGRRYDGEMVDALRDHLS